MPRNAQIRGRRSSQTSHLTCDSLFSQGSKLLPDFFLDEANPEIIIKENIKMAKQEAAVTGGGTPPGSVAKVFDTIKSLCDEELVKTINGVFEFDVSGTDAGLWYLDLKNGSGM